MKKGCSGLLSLLLLTAQLVLPGSSARAASCAAPGSSGVGGTLTTVANTSYPSPSSASSSAAGSTTLTVGSSGSIKVNDELLIIQMQSATISSSNSSAYGSGGITGSGTTANSAGLYEYVVATANQSGTTVSIRGAGAGGGLVNTYTSAPATSSAGRQSYQVIVVPQYSSATLSNSATLTASAWDGSTGGVVAFDVSGTLTLNGSTIDVSGLGFRGGAGRQLGGAASGVTGTDYVTPSTLNAQASKGEGVAGTPRYTYALGQTALGDNTAEGYPGGSYARGAPGNAGGGGTDSNPGANDQNTGGGGGGNGGQGGQGGNAWSSMSAVGGIGGAIMPYAPARLFMGGGGGAGTRNNSSGLASSGGPGGGMVFIRAGKVTGSGTIRANGGVGVTPDNDGGGGGGAGGSILFYAGASASSTLTLSADGARGTNAYPNSATEPHGPGGGGGGGVIYTNVSGASTSTAKGANGTTTTLALMFGAVAGTTPATMPAITSSSVPGLSPGDTCTAGAVTLTKQQQNVTTGGTLTANAVNVRPGDKLRYVLTATNNTFQTLTTFTLRDALNANLTPPSTVSILCVDGTTRSAAISGASLSIDIRTACGANLNPGQAVVVSFDTTVK